MKMYLNSIAMLLVLVGCASQATDQNVTTDAEIAMSFVTSENIQPVDRIKVSDSASWEILDSKHLILSSRRNEKFIIELRSICPGLGDIYDIVGVNRSSSSMLTNTDSVFAPDFGHTKCLIQSFYPLSKEQTEQLITKLKNN